MLKQKDGIRPKLHKKAQRVYLENQIRGAGNVELQQLLYEGLLRNVLSGKGHMEAEAWEEAHLDLSRAKRIVNYLLNSLKPEGGEITKQLRRLYAFCYDRIGRALVERQASQLDGVLSVVKELTGAWSDLGQKQFQDSGGGDAA